MNKKATSIILLIFEIIAVISVILITTSTAKAYGSSDAVQRIILAREIQFMINTLAGVPGEAVELYPYNVSEYSVILNSNSVNVFRPGKVESTRISFRFNLPQSLIAEGSWESSGSYPGTNQPQLCLEKNKQKITLKSCEPAADEATTTEITED